MADPPTESIPGEILVGSLSEVLHRAANHYNQAEYAAAAAICQTVVAQDSDNSEALHILGHIALRTGETDTAVGYFTRTVTLEPTDPRYSRSFAASLEISGRTNQAMHAWSQYITLNAEDADAHFHLARLLSDSGDHGLAATRLARATQLEPTNLDIRFALSVCLYKCNELSESIANFEALLKIRPDWAACHSGLSAALRQDQQIERAISHAGWAVSLQPEASEAHNNLGLAYFSAQRTDDTVRSLERARELSPDDAEVLNNLGVATAHIGDRDRAKAYYDQALKLRPGWAEALLNLANISRQENLLELAVETYQEALRAQPDDYRILGSLALTFLNLNDPQNAIASYEQALVLAPGNPELRKGLGIAQLLDGQFQPGWRNYEARLLCGFQRNFNVPRWDGEDLNGGRLLIHSEQGFGDTIQFCRYLPRVADKANAKSIIFETQRPLLRLLATVEGVDEVIARGDALPEIDRHVPLLSLPAIFETDFETIPGQHPYIAANEHDHPDWRPRLAGDKPRIGIVWKGNPRRQDDDKRSCPVAAFEPILKLSNYQFFSLQIDADFSETSWFGKHGVADLANNIKDFSDTAAIIAELDLVISVDTATAHLAGALGKPVWVLLGHAADWRYLTARDDSPWYPSMRLFRQSNRDNWRELANQVSRTLNQSFDF